jgi:hypothetical protein
MNFVALRFTQQQPTKTKTASGTTYGGFLILQHGIIR